MEVFLGKDNLGDDDCSRSWAVFIYLTPPETDPPLSFTNIDFYVSPTSRKAIKDAADFIGSSHLTIQETSKTVAKLDEIEIDRPLQNRGIGSLLYEYVETWACKNKITQISGDLSPVDSDHFDTLERFYKKYGFTFTIFKQPTTNTWYLGKVEKFLTL